MDNKKLEELFLTVQKPGRYCGGEQGSVMKDKEKVDIRFAFCFPDTYEVGMSHLGMKILYSQFNEREDIWCERVFAPWTDFIEVMKENDIPLFALESRDPIKDFDFIGFTLQYEMSYTNVLSMLDLAGLPLKSKDRKELSPIVVAGGPCVCNAEPLAEFIDLFFLGEGEEVDLEVMDLYKECKEKGDSKEEFLLKASKIEGVYVPSLYNVEYDGQKIKSITAQKEAPETVKKRIITDLDKSYYPSEFVVPYIEIVHDRAVQEIYRGCIRGCRFCQAGFIYRPVREKSADVISKQAKALCDSTGYDEISLSSLSTSDYTELEPLLKSLLSWTDKDKVSLSLPSLRIDNFSPELLKKINHIRKSGLTFAPEAGTQRLRDVINKNITEKEILDTCRIAFAGGHTSVKLYFMIGLPTETDDDIVGIAQLAQKIVDIYYSMEQRPKGKSVDVGVSVSTFVPKPFTPFQFEPQISREEILRRQALLRNSITTKKISLSWHDSATSFLEGVFARGDRRLSAVIETAYRMGCIFDSWSECFDLEKWLEAFEKCGINPEDYSGRSFDYEEVLPWEHLDYAVSKKFFIAQNKLAKEEKTTPNCRISCAGCGANCYGEGVCFEKR
ncbi:MAG: TIGR03960 family B12-binding radical SAM protein [Acutalibacteraceae bacterium]|nr:TIGR03960 family B12-binding radical SAM protein [Acutalibacteraceae bacterium]